MLRKRAVPRQFAGVLLVLGAQSCGAEDAAVSGDLAAKTDGESPIRIGELSAQPHGTTPTELPISLQSDLDQLRLTAYIAGPGNVPVTTCLLTRVYRIGPDAIDRPLAQVRALPLAYSETLPDGVYTERIRVQAYIYPNDFLYETGTNREFEIIAGAVRPLSSREYSERVTLVDASGHAMTAISGEAAAPDPCPQLPPLSDEIAIERAATVLDLAEWSQFGSIQPWRWTPPTTPAGVLERAELAYRTIDSSGTVLHFGATVSSDVLSTGALLQLGASARLNIIEDPSSRSGFWTASTGSVRIHPQSDGQLAVDLEDVLVTNDLDAEVERTIGAGRIAGQLRTQTPSE